MEKNELITLETVLGYTQDENGFKNTEMTAQMEVFCAVKSVGRTEYYEAARSGVKANIIFVVNKDDFDAAACINSEGKKAKPSRVIYNDSVYKIHRGYAEAFGDLELTCEEVE